MQEDRLRPAPRGKQQHQQQMHACFSMFAAVLGLVEVPTVFLLLWGKTLGEVTPWFDRVAPLDQQSYAYMYVGVLTLLLLSKFLSVYLPRHRLLQLHNAVVHIIELVLFASLLSMKHRPLSPTCCTLASLKLLGCGLFVRQAFKAFEPGSSNPLKEKK